MGLDYALVHLVFTIPPAIILTVILRPLLTRLDLYKICFLITVAVIYTIPWDAYLIYANVWTYPPDAILGPTLLRIPIEELFFFVIQTYTTSLLYILVNKPTLFAIYLRNASVFRDAEAKGPSDGTVEDKQRGDERGEDFRRMKYRKLMGQIFFASMTTVPWFSNAASKNGTYLRLICAWAGPVLLMLWALSWQLLLGLPQSKTRLPIIISTVYLWVVDTIALHRGTWSIGSGTKLGINLWPGLEVEEAVFFLVTNTMVVFGLCAFDNAIAILDIFPNLFPTISALPSPKRLVEALLVPESAYDSARLDGLRNALNILSKKSRSFYLASGVFSRRLRIDLVILYAFCRIADDLVDQAGNAKDAEIWISHLSHFLKVAYSGKQAEKQYAAALAPFSPEAQSVLVLLPTDRLPAEPLHALLDGFRSDVKFMTDGKARNLSPPTPIRKEGDLKLYASRVAATVAELCLRLVYFHDPARSGKSEAVDEYCLKAGKEMGIALQYINIVRDVTTDAVDGRCYIPADWFQHPAPNDVKEFQAELMSHRKRILNKAFELYAKNRNAIEQLPEYARDGIRVAVESYMEIGRVMKERIANGEKLDMAGGGKEGRASVPRTRRLWVGWMTMSGPRKT